MQAIARPPYDHGGDYLRFFLSITDLNSSIAPLDTDPKGKAAKSHTRLVFVHPVLVGLGGVISIGIAVPPPPPITPAPHYLFEIEKQTGYISCFCGHSTWT